MSDGPTYDDWIDERRSIDAPAELTDRVMAAVEEVDRQRNQVLLLWLVQRIESSRLARSAACLAACGQ
jgi:hypothetical protein